MLSHLQQVEIFTPKEKYGATVDFYKGLGFKIVEQRDESSILHLFSEIGINLKITVGNEPFSLDIKVEDVASFKESLKQQGLVLDGEIIKDPVGNTIRLNPKALFESPPSPANVQITETVPADSKLPKPVPEKYKKRIGVLCSGGDSCGMNAAVRSITRVAIQRGCIPYAIYEGYQGLVDGGDKIKEFSWDDVRCFLAQGGTNIGTARCKAFRERSGRLQACYNLIKNGIDALVVIGGDGSLTGADMFRQEWTGLVDELVAQQKVTVEESSHLRSDLAIVGLVGSIDNDMSSTDITIGAVTSLHRICESVDSLVSTAQSHQRAFVVEVMGRNCGWLALMAAIAVGADFCFLPEHPPPLNQKKYGNDWAQEMCDLVKTNRARGNRKSLVIVCEGAIDKELNHISPEMVKKVLETNLGLDTRVTTLGHVQRGGSSCAFDRYLATIQGQEAVESVLRSTPEIPAPMIGMSNNKIISIPLMEAVKLTKEVSVAIGQKNFKHAMELRDPDFTSAYDSYMESSVQATNAIVDSKPNRLRVGIMHVGAPAGGMNAATRVLVRLCLSRGHTPVIIKNGFTGLASNEVSEFKWEDVRGWQTLGGTNIGTNRDHPSIIPGVHSFEKPKGVENFIDIGTVAYHLQKFSINALIIVGGFEAFTSILTLSEARKIYPALCIPLIQIPATISNNIPATDFSIGTDTALNVIVNACDSIRLSANASQKRVFVVEVHGGSCGFLSTMSGLTVGATAAYIPEEKLTLNTLQEDVKHLLKRYREEEQDGITNGGRVILRSENCTPKVYSTKAISDIFKAEGAGVFDSRESVLGHLQQGNIPSPLDRIRATRMAVKAMDFLESIAEKIPESNSPFKCYTEDQKNAVIIGIKGANLVATPVHIAREEADMKNRSVKSHWWMPLRKLIRVLGGRDMD